MSAPFEIVCKADDREVWHPARLTGIGASESPKILGLSPESHGSLLDMYAAKVDPRPAENPTTGPLARGHDLEPIILAKANEGLAPIGESCERYQHLIRSTAYAWCLATLDAVLRSAIIPVEFKSSSAVDLSAPPHKYWLCQLQHQMLACGADHGYLVVLDLWEWDWRIWRVERDEGFIRETLIPACEHFWFCVQNRIEPKSDNQVRDVDVWQRLHVQDDGSEILLADSIRPTLDALTMARSDKRDAENRERAAKATIQLVMGDAKVGVLPDGTRLQYATEERSEYTVAASKRRVIRILKN